MGENKKIVNGIFHVHTDNSTKDSALTIDRLIERCKELGVTAVTLTDHGVMTGIYEFLKKCKEAGIKGVPGVEAYVKGMGPVLSRVHMILVAKDAEGLKAINKAVSESYNPQNMEDGFPLMNIDILKKFMGPGSPGYGHVFATSACVAGPLAQILLNNMYVEKEVLKRIEKQKGYENPESPEYKILLKQQEDILQKLETLTAERDALNVLSKKAFFKKEKTVKALEGTDLYAQAKAELDAEILESKTATEKLAAVREEISKISKEKTRLNGLIKDSERDHEKWNVLQREIEELKGTLRPDDALFGDAKKLALQLSALFGAGNFYIELQYHGIDTEAKVMPKLVKLADELNLPVVAANDVHTATNSEEDLLARQLMRSQRYNKWEERKIGDDQLYIKTDEELAKMLEKILPSDTVAKAMKGIGTILEACKYDPGKPEHYPVFKSDNGEDADLRLRRLAFEGIKKRYPNPGDWTQEHLNRLEYELETISSMGYSDYHCIVEDFIRYGKKIVLDNPEGVGLGVGPGRGSAAGSLVCYLIGITAIDPMKYGLLFERFLNKDRVSMPDIDTDYHTQFRGKVMEYARTKYGKNAVCNIVTKSRQGVKGSIRNRARLLGSERYDDTTVYQELGDTIAKAVPNIPGITFDKCYDDLMAKFKGNADAKKIIDEARLIEGVTITYGMHAAGVIISDNDDVSEYVPLMYDANNDAMKCQCDMTEAEENGLLKMDFLGLKNLDIITSALRKIKRRHGISIDAERLPFEDKVFSEIFAKGYTNAVFQFESGGMKQMLRDFKPDKFEDLILLVAAYRPGPLQFIPSIIAVKHGRKLPEYAVPEMDEILGVTYGYPIYQEQVMQIFNRFAGFTLGESDIIRRYMSKKKTEKFIQYKDRFIEGMIKSGALKEKAEALWDQLVDFSKYAFNKSHAAAYAYLAYITAWLKYHYPVEYLSSVMDLIPSDKMADKMPGLISDCKRAGIRVLQPDINRSEIGFSIQGNDILFGLSSVKNVGASAEQIVSLREDVGRFTSFTDFLVNGHVKKDVTESLIKAGAFDNFCNNRQALLAVFNSAQDLLKKLANKRKITLKEGDAKKGKNAQESVNKLIADIAAMKPAEEYPEDKLIRLNEEKELLGVYVSAHPMDEYKSPKEMGCTPIEDIAKCDKVKIMGLITNLRLTQRKSDGAPMAFFTLEDLTGNIEVNCFSQSFASYGSLVGEEGKVVLLEGKVVEEEAYTSSNDDVDNTDGNDTIETVLKFNMYSAKPIEPEMPKIRLWVKHLIEWDEILQHKVRAYRTGKGNPLIIYDAMMGEYRETDWRVSPDILKSGLNVSMM